MKTDFFYKKTLLVAGILSAFAVVSSFSYAQLLRKTQIVDLNENFYFLVSEEENVPAAALDGYLAGGAGYVMNRGKNSYAVLSCYFTEADATNVCNKLADRKLSSAVVKESGGILYLKKRSEKENAEKLKGCFETLNCCCHVLYDIANKAEEGEYTQQRLKSLLSDVGAVLSGIAKENRDGLFAGISLCAANAAQKTKEIVSDTVYAKDIRCLQIYLCDSYLLLASEFSL